MDEGRGIGVSLPVTALVDQFYAELQAMGAGRQDTSALLRRLPRRGAK
jgi:3-hydroxyisobutyrate dehydrogenase